MSWIKDRIKERDGLEQKRNQTAAPAAVSQKETIQNDQRPQPAPSGQVGASSPSWIRERIQERQEKQQRDEQTRALRQQRTAELKAAKSRVQGAAQQAGTRARLAADYLSGVLLGEDRRPVTPRLQNYVLPGAASSALQARQKLTQNMKYLPRSVTDRDSVLMAKVNESAGKAAQEAAAAGDLQGVVRHSITMRDTEDQLRANGREQLRLQTERLRGTDPAAYYSQTMQANELAARVQSLQTALPEAEQRMLQLRDAMNAENIGLFPDSDTSTAARGAYAEAEREYERIKGELASYESALSQRRQEDKYREQVQKSASIEAQARAAASFEAMSAGMPDSFRPYAEAGTASVWSTEAGKEEWGLKYSVMDNAQKEVFHYLWRSGEADGSGHNAALAYMNGLPGMKQKYDVALANKYYIPQAGDNLFEKGRKVLWYIVDSLTSGTEAAINEGADALDGKTPTGNARYANILGVAMQNAGDGFGGTMFRAAGSAAQSTGRMLPSMMAGQYAAGLLSAFPTAGVQLGEATHGILSGEKAVRGVQNTAFFLTTKGSAMREGAEKGLTGDSLELYSLLSAASEVYLQNVIGGIAQFGGISESQLAARVNNINNIFLRTAAHVGLSMSGEVVEEELQNVLEPLFVTILTGNEYQAPTAEEMLETLLSTILMVGATNAGDTARYYNSSQIRANLQSISAGARAEGGEYLHVADRIDELIRESDANPDVRYTREDIIRAFDLMAAAENRMQSSGVTAEDIKETFQAKAAEVENESETMEAQTVQPERPAAQNDGAGDDTRAVYEQTLRETADQIRKMDDRDLRVVADSVEQNLNETRDIADPTELARMEGQLDALRQEISQREAVSRNGERLAQATERAALSGKADAGSVDWNGSREAADADSSTPLRSAQNDSRAAAKSGQSGNQTEGGLSYGRTAEQGAADGGQRDAGLGADRQAGGLGGRAEGSVAGGQGKTELAQLRNQIRAFEAERRSAAQIGVNFGTKNENLRVVPEELYTSAMREEQARAEENGVRLTFVAGGAIELRGKGGRIITADGLHQVDADGAAHIFARADSRRFSPEQLTRHEDFHNIVANNRGLLLDMVEALYEEQGEEGVARMVDAYVVALDGCYGVYTEGMDEDAQRALAVLYIEEIFADQYAGMNRSSGEARRAAAAAGGVAQRFAGDIENARQNRAGIERRNGPGTRFSIQDVQGQNGDYPDCVVLDTNLFDGVKPRDWGAVLQNYVYNNLTDKELAIFDENWYKETVKIARYQDRVTKSGAKNSHRVIDDLARNQGNNIKNLAVAHIPELLVVSTYDKGNHDNNHQWLDQNGWTHRKAYICDKAGKIYEATLNIAEGRDRRILYDISLIKEKDRRTAGGAVPSTVTGRGSPTSRSSSKKILPDPNAPVKHFSTEEQIARIDADYQRAVDSGDMRTAQRMVDEAAKRAGYDMELYHGSKKGGGFTVFKDWQYFTPNKAYAERYMERDNPDSLYHVYVKSERMFDTRRPECREIFEQMRAEYGLSELQENGLPDWTDGYDISDFIEENGLDFDGVVLDEGGDLTEDGPVSRGVSYIIRSSEQVKSAEPVTYDDNGDPVDLSERFRTDRSGEEAWKNRDIRFSPSEDAGDSWGVDWIGKETGEADSSPAAQNEKTRDGRQIAGATEGNGGRSMSASTEERGRQSAVPTEGGADSSTPLRSAQNDSYAAQAREKKEEIARKASADGLKSRIQTAEERLKALKSAERMGLVTEESKRQELQRRIADTQETIDILKAELDRKKAARSAQKADKAAKAEAKAQRKAEKLEAQKAAELRDNKPRQARKEFRQDALNLFSVPAAKRQTLGDLLNRFADKVIHQGSVTEQDRRELFTSLYEAGVETIQGDEYYKQIRDFTRGGRIYVPQELRAEFGDDWDDFRKRAWGNGIYLTNDQNDRGADAWNVELAELFPGSFDAGETDSRTILEGIVGLAEEGKAEHVSIEEMMQRNQSETGVSIDQQMDELERKVDALIDTFAQKAELEVQLRKAGTMQLVKERQKNREIAARQVQRKKENDTRNQVMKQIQQLNKMRKKSAPEIQRQIDSIIGNLDTMARSISPEGLENLQALARKYEEAKSDPNFLGNPYVEQRLVRLGQTQLDSLEISDVIELGRTVSALVKSVTEDKRLLTDARGQEIEEAAKAAQKEISSSAGSKGGKLRAFFGSEHLSPTREIQRLGGWVRGGTMEKLSRALEDGGTRRMEYQRQATRIFDKFLADKENQAWLQKAQGKKAEWISVTVPAGITGTDVLSGERGAPRIENVTFEITPMMRVGLLMHSQNLDNLRHIQTGGIVIPNKELYMKGDLANADARGMRVKLQPEIVRAIVKDCTAQERAFARLLEEYYDQFSKEKINEVSMQIDGFERAGGDHYYTIKVSRKFLAAQPEQVQKNLSLESIGSIVNERIHAGNPITLEDASTALTSHIDQISKYYGYTAAIRDFNAVMNYTFHFKGKTKEGGEYVANTYADSVKETLQAKWGAEAQTYLDDLLAGLQQSSSINETAAQFMAKLRGNMAGASLMFNPAVALSQTASLPGAMQALGLDGLAAALKPEKVDMGLVEKYSPILWYRNQGNSTQELGDYMKQQGLEGKLPFFFNWIQKMDSWTIRRIWAGAEYRVSKDTDLSPGSQAEIDAGTDPFYQEVARVFQRAVYDTQPNYSEMQRPAILRSKSDLTRALTMYKTVPLQYYNMMYEAVGRLRADTERVKADPNNKQYQAAAKQSRSFAAKTFAGILGANVTYVVMKALIKGTIGGKKKKYLDEEGELDWGKVFGSLGKDLIDTYAGSVIFGSDLLTAGEKFLDAATTGSYSRYGGTEISFLSAIEDTLGGVYNLAKEIHDQDLTGGLGAVKELAKQFAMVSGIPANNMENYILGSLKWIAPEWVDRYENLFDEIERPDLKGEYGRDLRAALTVLMDNRTDGLKDETIEELLRLWGNGQTVQVPSAVPASISIDGESRNLSADERSRFREIWGKTVSDSLERLIESNGYEQADDIGKAKLIKKLYDYARQQAVEAAVGKEPDAWVLFGKACVDAGVRLEDYLAVAAVGKDKLKDIDGTELDAAIAGRMQFRIGELGGDSLDEFGRLYATGATDVIPGDVPTSITVGGTEIKCSPEERVAWMQAWGRTAGESLEAVMGSKAYQAADDAGKEKLIAAVFDYARAAACSSVTDSYAPDKWITIGREAESRGLDADEYIIFRQQAKDLKSAEKLDLLKKQSWTEGQKEYIWMASMASEAQLTKYKPLKEAGVKWATAMDLLGVGEASTAGMTQEETARYQAAWDRISGAATKKLMANATYRKADKATQSSYVDKLNAYVTQTAKVETLKGYTIDKWVECGQKLSKAGVALDEYIVYSASTSDARSRDKYAALNKTGWTESQKLEAMAYISESTHRVATVGMDYQVGLSYYLDALANADADQSGNINQEEAEDYIDRLDLGWEDKAYLWQMVCSSSKWKNNPYSAGMGEDIWHSLHPDN